MTDALLFCCGQFEAIFCQYTFVSKFQFSGPLESIWTHDINFLLRIEWILWKNMIFFILGPKKGFFGGINRFNPQYFWPIILPNFLGGLFTGPWGPNLRFWDVHFFRNYISFLTIYNTWGLELIWGLGRPNKKIIFLKILRVNYSRDDESRFETKRWLGSKSCRKQTPIFFKKNGGLFSSTFWSETS